MNDEPKPEPTPYDVKRCKGFSKRVFTAGLDSEWKKVRHGIWRSGTVAERERKEQQMKMQFIGRLEEVESEQQKQDSQPAAVRKLELENLAASIPDDRRTDLQKDRDWAGNSLRIPVGKLSAPPSRRAVTILLFAEEDATFRRGLLTDEKKSSGKNDDDGTDKTGKLSEREQRLRGVAATVE